MWIVIIYFVKWVYDIVAIDSKSREMLLIQNFIYCFPHTLLQRRQRHFHRQWTENLFDISSRFFLFFVCYTHIPECEWSLAIDPRTKHLMGTKYMENWKEAWLNKLIGLAWSVHCFVVVLYVKHTKILPLFVLAYRAYTLVSHEFPFGSHSTNIPSIGILYRMRHSSDANVLVNTTIE